MKSRCGFPRPELNNAKPAIYRQTLKLYNRDHMRQKQSDKQYLIKVKLKGNRRIWRLLVLRGDQTLDDLHETIYLAFDRYDEHLYSFYFPKAPTRQQGFGLQPKEYTSPNAIRERDDFDDQKRFNAARTKLDGLHLRVGQTFEYLFDFGDMWWHELKVVGMGSVDPKSELPMVAERHGDSPEQYPANDE
jgi:hypothetical protein